MNKLMIGGVLLLLSAAPQAMASVITNGGFTDCSYNGWSKDTDGAGDISVLDDFTITSGPNCAAELLVDAGNTEAWFANTLFQNISLNSGARRRCINAVIQWLPGSTDRRNRSQPGTEQCDRKGVQFH